MPGGTRVGGETFFDALRLANIQHVVCRVEHAIDTRRCRRELDRALDGGPPDSERPLAGKIDLIIDLFRQAGFVVFVR